MDKSGQKIEKPFRYKLSNYSLKYGFQSKAKNRGGGTRRPCEEFTRRARKTMLENAEQYRWRYMFTLTYGEVFPKAWKAKEMLRSILKKIRRTFGRVTFLWRFEFQKRGAPHFHVLTAFGREISKTYFEHFLKREWGKRVEALYQGVWNPDFWGKGGKKFKFKEKPCLRHGAKVDELKTSRGGMAYCSKYCAKINNSKKWKEIEPIGNIGRLWGIEGKRDNIPGVIHRCLSQESAVIFESKIIQIIGEERYRIWLEYGKVYLGENEWKEICREFIK